MLERCLANYFYYLATETPLTYHKNKIINPQIIIVFSLVVVQGIPKVNVKPVKVDIAAYEG